MWQCFVYALFKFLLITMVFSIVSAFMGIFYFHCSNKLLFAHSYLGVHPKRYLSDCVSTVSAVSGRYRLRSTGSETYILPRTRTRFGERGFFYSGPAAWNTLSSDLHDIDDSSTFRKRLRNVPFDRAFNWFCWRSWTCRIAAPYKFCVDWLIDWPQTKTTTD